MIDIIDRCRVAVDTYYVGMRLPLRQRNPREKKGSHLDQKWDTPQPTDALTWEPQSTDGRAATDRAVVPGGWLYRSTAYSSDADPIAVSICFVPDAPVVVVPDAGVVAA